MKKLRDIVRNFTHFMRDLVTLVRLVKEVASEVDPETWTAA